MSDLRRGLWARLWTRAQEWLLRGWSSTATFRGRRTGFWSSSSLTPADTHGHSETESETPTNISPWEKVRCFLQSKSRRPVRGILWKYEVIETKNLVLPQVHNNTLNLKKKDNLSGTEEETEQTRTRPFAKIFCKTLIQQRPHPHWFVYILKLHFETQTISIHTSFVAPFKK